LLRPDFRGLTPMPTFEVHYEQDKQVYKELVEADTAENAWKEFVRRSRGKDKQVVCVIRHELE
jgi:hypothetical protein